MSNRFRDRLKRLHDAHQRGREDHGGPTGVYSVEDAAVRPFVAKDGAAGKSAKKGWESLGAIRCDDFDRPFWIYSERNDGGKTHGCWTLRDCLAVDHGELTLLDEEVPPGVEPERLLYMDTETSGLGKDALAFMVGIGFWEGGEFVVEHLLLDDPKDERGLLQAFAERLSARDVLVTFNGRRFDVPLLARRFERCGLRDPFAGKRHLDLLPLARRILPGRKRYRLSSLERDLLRFKRVDDVPGREIPPLWRRYCQNGEARPMKGVLEHNRHDIVSMAALLATAVEGQRREGPVAEKLERSYRLRGEFAKSGARKKPETPAGGSDSVEKRVKELRGAGRLLIDRGLWQQAFPLICEVVALAPEDRWGVQMMARYYSQAGEAELAKVLGDRF